MKHTRALRLPALGLALLLILSPAARALTLDQAREMLEQYYIDEVPQSVLDRGSIPEMLEALGDPYTEYFTAEEYALFNSTMEDTRLVGVGVTSLVTDQGLEIQRVYEDTPAAEGGLQAGDIIVAVDGQPAAGQDGDTVSGWLRGEPGTAVAVTFLRDGAEHTVTLTRRELTLPATYTELWEDHIGYIDCDNFGDETLDHFLDGMETYGDQADHWIVDLRGNGGGQVAAAADAANCFTGPSPAAYFQDREGNLVAFGGRQESQTLYPVIVLTDYDTASAAEVFAGAIRDGRAGILIGTTTYGKGVAQSVFDQTLLPDYFPEGDAIKITSLRGYSPDGNTPDTMGVIPHLLVDPTLAPDVAVLLSASSPAGDTEGYLRIDFVWRWYVDLEQALSDEYRAAFTALLEALPGHVRVLEGTGGPDGWADTGAAALAEQYGLTGYSPRTFSDIDDSPYADQILRLAAYDLIRGDGTGAFLPEEGLTRAQLCALLAQVLQLRVPTGESQFSDVSMDDWYGQCINAAARMGLVEGAGGGRFDPNAPVTHEQLITILGRVALRINLLLELDVQAATEEALAAPALERFAGWARESVWLLALSQQGLLGNTISLLWAPLDEIDPAASATREEAAALTCSLLNYIGILPS